MSYAHNLHRPAPKAKDGKPVFSVNIVMGPDSVLDLFGACKKLADVHWQENHDFFIGDDGVIKLRGASGAIRVTPLKVGDFFYQQKPATMGIYRGMYFINPSTSPDKPPVYRDEREQPCPPEKFYSGCYGRAFIEIASIADVQGYTKGLTAYLRGVQFARHGESLAGFDAASAAAQAYAAAPLPVDPNAPTGPIGGAPAPAAFAPPAGGFVPPGAVPPGAVAPAGFAAPPSGAAPWTPPGAAR
jgi:hypothetical protein